LGIFGSLGGEAIRPALEEIFTTLFTSINSTPRSSEFVYATENAISSVGKIIFAQADYLGNSLPGIVSTWLSHLPLEVDEVEGRVIHDLLCDMCQIPNSYIFGENYSNLPKILSIFGDVILSEFAEESTDQKIISIIQSMQIHIPSIFQESISQVSLEHQKRLAKNFQQ